jgi:hypothetical protein
MRSAPPPPVTWDDAHAAALAIACGLLIGASFYPFLAAVFLAVPFVAWLYFHYRMKEVQIAQFLFVAAIIGLAAALVFSPYLDARDATDTLRRTTLHYAPWSGYLRGGLYSPAGQQWSRRRARDEAHNLANPFARR